MSKHFWFTTSSSEWWVGSSYGWCTRNLDQRTSNRSAFNIRVHRTSHQVRHCHRPSRKRLGPHQDLGGSRMARQQWCYLYLHRWLCTNYSQMTATTGATLFVCLFWQKARNAAEGFMIAGIGIDHQNRMRCISKNFKEALRQKNGQVILCSTKVVYMANM